MQDLFASGRMADIILAVMAAEMLIIGLVLRRKLALRIGPILANTGAGAALVLALRFTQTGQPWTWTAGALVLALGAHIADLGYRFNEGSSGPTRGDQ